MLNLLRAPLLLVACALVVGLRGLVLFGGWLVSDGRA